MTTKLGDQKIWLQSGPTVCPVSPVAMTQNSVMAEQMSN